MNDEAPKSAGEGLRENAEARLEALNERSVEPSEMARMIHEMRVHQVELELQNEELIEARSELELSKETLADLYDFAPVGYFSITPGGHIRRLNLKGAAMLGLERAKVKERLFAEFVSPDDRPAFGRFLAHVLSEGESGVCEVKLLPKEQAEVIVSLKGGLAPESGLFRVVAMDVTGQRRAEALEREKYVDLERLFNRSHDLLAIAGSDGRFHRVNPAFERVLGYSSEHLTSCDFMSFVHPDDREATLAAMDKLRAGEDVLDFTNRYRSAQGFYRWLEWRVTPYGDGVQCALARDITERKEAEDALRRSEERFRCIVESLPTAMCLYQLGDDGQLYLTAGNPAADKELGVSHVGLIGKRLEQTFPGFAETGNPAMFGAVARGELGVQKFETGYDHHGGFVCLDVTVFQTHPGSIAVIFMDVSERKKARLAREKIQEELESRVEKRTAQLKERTLQLRALAVALSHAEESEQRRIADLIHEDLQQSLVAALVNLGLLKSRFSGRAEADEFGLVEGIIRDSLMTARSLTVELSPPVLQERGLGAALIWLHTWCGEKYAMDLKVEVEDGSDPDPEACVILFRCVRELLVNTVKHAGVRAAELRMWKAGHGIVKIEVSDHGCGFDPDEVRAREGSTGSFGLFSIRERLEWLGGGFEIDSSPGNGSRFTLTVPVKTG